ncbi:MAG: hypothetical protein IKC88_04980, partial [Opitutales bacterium]|nr:hypothetical protein [Opitutales bacterium]
MENQDNKLLEILQQEKFLAFFDFCKIGDNGTSEIDGLCKVAIPQNIDNIDYMCLTFIFDTPTEASKNMAKRIMATLTADAFKKSEASVYAVTSVPAIMRQSENYIHQLDVIFRNKVEADYKSIINRIVFTIRNSAGLHTEVPQWWEESDAP